MQTIGVHESSLPAHVEALFVGDSAEDEITLRSIFRRAEWTLEAVGTCREAIEFIDLHPISVVITDAQLADGDWKDLLRGMPAFRQPLLIVASAVADEYLWAEVLNLGCYDLLVKPFDAREVEHVVGLACSHWQRENPDLLTSEGLLMLAAAHY